jgi:L-ascorbate metabolism protein UlaG (beta-lactamase superfamily)
MENETLMSSNVEARRNIVKMIGMATAATVMPSTVTGSSSTKASAQESEGIRVRRLTWAGVMLETSKIALFIDAVTPPSEKDGAPDLFNTTKEAHALVTHNHGDHFDSKLLKKILGDSGLLVCQRATADWIDQRAFRVQPVDSWQPVFFPRYGDDFVAFAVPAVDGWGVPQSSWVVDGGGIRVFHAGDTQWHGRFADIGRAYGPFDAAFLPINGARQQDGRFSDLGIPAVLTPEQAVAAAKLLRAKLLIPIHYGKPDPPSYVEVSDPLRELMRHADKSKIAIKPLQTGDVLQLNRDTTA